MISIGIVFGACEPITLVHYCDHALSAVRRLLFNFDCSENAKQNLTKLDM